MGFSLISKRRGNGSDSAALEHGNCSPEAARRLLRREEGLKKLGPLREAWGLLRGAEIKTWDAVGADDNAKTSVIKVGMFVARVLTEEETLREEDETAPHD